MSDTTQYIVTADKVDRISRARALLARIQETKS